MTQIQAYENMSKEALVEHHRHTLQQHADDMDMLSKELASRAAPVDPYRALMADQAELINIERLQRWLTKYRISTPESLEELGAKRGHYVNALTRQEPFAPARSEPVVMGNGDVAVGTITRGDDGTPGIIYLRLPEVREHNTDCSDIYPIGSAAPDDSILACIYFGSSEVLQQTIDVLFDLQREHYPIAPVAAQAQWIEHCNITDIPDAVLTPSGLAIKSEQADHIRDATKVVARRTGPVVKDSLPAESPYSLSDTDRAELAGAMGLLAGHGYKGSAAAIKRVLDNAPKAVAQSPAITLNGYQLLQALETVAPDYQTDIQQLECEARIQHGEGHSGKGYYCWLADYPEEGATLLLDDPTEPQLVKVYKTNDISGSVDSDLAQPCTCPSGNGSLRWPCPVHPPEE